MENSMINFKENSRRLRISWDNSKVKTDSFALWFTLLGLIIFFLMACYGTLSIFTSGFWQSGAILFLILGWLGIFLTCTSLVRILWSEWIEIDSQAISWGASGLASGLLDGKPKRVLVSKVVEFCLGRIGRIAAGDEQEVESMLTLNVYEAPKNTRHLLAYWLAEEHKECIYNRVKLFVEQRSIRLHILPYRPGTVYIRPKP